MPLSKHSRMASSGPDLLFRNRGGFPRRGRTPASGPLRSPSRQGCASAECSRSSRIASRSRSWRSAWSCRSFLKVRIALLRRRTSGPGTLLQPAISDHGSPGQSCLGDIEGARRRLFRLGPVGWLEAVHVDRCIENGAPEMVGQVRIGARIEQEKRKIIVSVDGRQDQRGYAIGFGDIEVRAGSDEHTRGIRSALTSGEEKGRHRAARRMEIIFPSLGRAGYTGHSVDRALISAPCAIDASTTGRDYRRRPHQRRLPLPRFVGVGVRAPAQERVDSIGTAGTRGAVKNGLALRGDRVGAGAGRQQLPR